MSTGDNNIALTELENANFISNEIDKEVNDLSGLAADEGQDHDGDGDEYY